MEDGYNFVNEEICIKRLQKSITKIKDILESVTGLRNIFIDV